MSQSVEALLQELVTWTRVGFFVSVKGVLADVLDSEKKRQIYQAADGTKTIDQIRKQIGVSPNTVSQVFSACQACGIMDVAESGQRRRLFDLNDFGLAVDTDESMK